MATHRIPIMGATTLPDATGECFMDNINNQMALATLLARNLVMVLKDPTADCGFYGSFQVPQNYSATGTTKVVVVGVLDGTVGATTLAFEFSYISKADGETVESAWTDSDKFEITSLSGSGYANEELVALASSAITAADFAAADEVMYYFKRDFSDDSFVGDFHVLGLYFEYTD